MRSQTILATVLAWVALAGAVRAAEDEPATQPGGQAGARAARVKRIFHARCAACHTSAAAEPGGKLDYITDLKRLAANPDLVAPGDPEGSEVWIVLDEKEMPPKKSELGPLRPDQVQAVYDWIQSGAPDAPGAAREEKPPTLQRLAAWSGNLHMPMVHFPIALLMCALLAEILFARTGRAGLQTVVRFCLWIGLLAAAPAAVFGWMRAEHGTFSGDLKQWTLWWHRALGIAVVGAALVAAVLAEIRARRDTKARRILLRLVLLAQAALVGATGAFGGAIVYGWSHYLP